MIALKEKYESAISVNKASQKPMIGNQPQSHLDLVVSRCVKATCMFVLRCSSDKYRQVCLKGAEYVALTSSQTDFTCVI